MKRIKEYIPVSISKILYFFLIYPYFNYCIEIWGSTSQFHINKMVLLQKRVGRIVKDVHFSHHTDELSNEMKILRLNDIYKFNIGLYMYNPLSILTMMMIYVITLMVTWIDIIIQFEIRTLLLCLVIDVSHLNVT